MKFQNLFHKKRRSESFWVLDIGTETVKTLIFRKENNINIILAKTSEYFEIPEVFGNFDFQEEILQKTILKAVKETQKISKIKTKNLFLGLPTNILQGRIVCQSFQRKNPKGIINKLEEQRIYEEVFGQIKTKLSQELAQKTELLPQDFYFPNLKVLKIKVDGYEVPAIQNLSGQNLEFKVFVASILKNQLEKIRKICHTLDLKILKISHLAENLSQIFPDKAINAIYLDIGGRLTNIFLVEKGKLEAILNFGKGGMDFTEKLSQSLGLPIPEARVLKENYSNLLLSEKVSQRIKEFFIDTLQNWFENLKENLKKFPQKLLPSNVFLFGGGALIPGIIELLEQGNWDDLAFISKPKIELLSPQNLKIVEDKNQILNSPQDIPPLLLFWNFNKDNI